MLTGLVVGSVGVGTVALLSARRGPDANTTGPFVEHFAQTDRRWEEGSRHGRFTTIFDGYGTVAIEDEALVLSPKAAQQLDKTHAALVVARLAHDDRVDFEATMTPTAQLRRGDPPNVWETGWLVWNYVDPSDFWYLILKPNGWEVGRVDPATKGQVFVATGDEFATPIGVPRRVRVHHRSPLLTIWVDGELLLDRTDIPAGHTPLFGFYTEDATVVFDDIASPGSPARPPTPTT